jgi:uncharacterized protein (DUF362 family)
MVSPGIVIVGSNSVASDAVAVCLMKKHRAHRMEDVHVRDHLSFKVGEERGIGSSSISKIELIANDLVGDSEFSDTVNFIKTELAYER